MLAALISSLNAAFRNALAALADAHGNEPGPWLDQLEEVTVATIKSAVSEGVAIETEAEAITAGLTLVQATFAELRREIGS